MITLPPIHIFVNTLFFPVPVTLKGSPGSILEVTNGSLIVSSTHLSDTQKLVLCELSLVFNADRRCLPNKRPVALFVLDTPSAYIEIRDCDIRSVAHETHNISVEDSGPYMVQDVCIWSHAENRKASAGTALVSSCNVSGFFEFYKAGPGTSFRLEKCHVSDCGGNAISAINPKALDVEQCVIERCQCSSLDIKLQDEPQSVPADSMSICISHSDIRSNGMYGVNIWSEHHSTLPLSVSITSNKVTSCRKEAIAVRHVTLRSLSILSNDLSMSQGTGCWVQKVYPLNPESSISISLNRCFDSHSGYGIYLYDTVGILDGNECFRNSCNCHIVGGLMFVGAPTKDTSAAQDLVIANSTIHTNGENGVTVLDFTHGTVTIERCRVYENFHNGLYFLQSKDPGRNISTRGSVLIDHCDILRNRQHGLTLSMVSCFINESNIGENGEGAVALDERSKQLLRFSSEAEEDVRARVQGEIGGPWGTIYPEKKGLCGKGGSGCDVM